MNHFLNISYIIISCGYDTYIVYLLDISPRYMTNVRIVVHVLKIDRLLLPLFSHPDSSRGQYPVLGVHLNEGTDQNTCEHVYLNIIVNKDSFRCKDKTDEYLRLKVKTISNILFKFGF